MANPLHKVFAIIEAVVAKQDRGASYSEIVSALNLAKSTVHRILKDLTELGYLVYDQETKRYFGSLRLAAIGGEVISHFQLRNHVRPYLITLNQKTDHTANLSVLDGNMGVFVDKIESKVYGIKLFSEVGKRFPLHCTAMGKILLAFSNGEVATEILSSPLEALTDKTITDPEELRKQLALIRNQKYALEMEELTRGIMCAAAPLFGIHRKLLGAISVTFPVYVNDDRGIDSEIEAVICCGKKISQSWDHHPWV